MLGRIFSRHFAMKRKSKSSYFIDKTILVSKGGDGGCGVNSFEAVQENPHKKRPEGGDGGVGGNVYLMASKKCQSLHLPTRHWNGENGGNGGSRAKNGRGGKDKTCLIPIGTTVQEIIREEDEWGDLIKETYGPVYDMDEHGKTICLAKGGNPGWGNQRYSSLPLHYQPPKYNDLPHNRGQLGETRKYLLTLKSIADVGLVGYPNAGKSSLLCALSKAQPKVDGYKFTTLHPTVGKVVFPDYHTFSVADIPGLVDDAHLNKGLGHEFLRHIQRTKLLLYVLDCSGWEEERNDPVRDLMALQREIRIFDPSLCDRPALVVGNKIDMKNSKKLLKELRKASELPVIGISAKTGENVEKLATHLRSLLQDAEREANRLEVEEKEGVNNGGNNNNDDEIMFNNNTGQEYM